jgi:hypothetical protein
MSVLSERDVLREGLREVANELEAIEGFLPEALEEVSLRLRMARTGIGVTLQEANAHRSHPQPFSISRTIHRATDPAFLTARRSDR